MSNQTEITTATYSVTVRDNDELEGTLLLPVATAVGGGDDGNDAGGGGVATNVLPQSSFEYETAIAAEQQQQQQQDEYVQQVQIDNEQEQIAYNLPTANSYSDAITDDSHSNVQKAQNIGLVNAEEEQEAIRRANRKIFPLGYHTDFAVRQANQIAKQRNCEGLQVTDEIQQQQQQHELLAMSTSTSSHEKEEEQQKKKKGYNVGGGYEVKDYQFGSDYEVKEYKTAEYKSVYD